MHHDEPAPESGDDAVGDEGELDVGRDDRDGIVDGQRLIGYFADGKEIVIGLDAADHADDGLGVARLEPIARLIERNGWGIRRRGGRGRLFVSVRASRHQTSRDNCSAQRIGDMTFSKENNRSVGATPRLAGCKFV